MGETKNQQSKYQNQDGHQNQPPKKRQNPNDPRNRQAEHSQQIGVDDIKEGWQRRGIGTPYDKKEKQPTHTA